MVAARLFNRIRAPTRRLAGAVDRSSSPHIVCAADDRRAQRPSTTRWSFDHQSGKTYNVIRRQRSWAAPCSSNDVMRRRTAWRSENLAADQRRRSISAHRTRD
jgi:hypothetical protein